MKFIYTLFSCIFLSLSLSYAQEQANDKFQQFSSLMKQYGNESKEVKTFLENWEKEDPTNAEMLYSWSIYYYVPSRDLLEKTDDLKEFEHSANLPDTITRFGQLQIRNFWIVKDKGEGLSLYKKAIDYMDKAIALHPNILELYINKTEVLANKWEFKYAASTLMDVIHLNHEDENRWTDFYGKSMAPHTKEVVEYYIQETFGNLISNKEFSLAQFICDTLISLYPNSVGYKFDKGIIYMQTFQKEKALQYFLDLNKEFPNEGNVLNMLANIYKEAGDNENLKKYATQMLQLNEPQWAAIGQELLSSLEPFSIDFQKIQEWYNLNKEEYAALVERFKKADTALSLNELANLYFAHACTEQCKGPKLWSVSLDSLLKAENFKECYEESKECLEQHPASLAALTYMVMAGQQVQASDLENPYIRLTMLVNMIKKGASSKVGDTDTKFKFYNILWREDENVFVDYFIPQEEKQKTSFFANPGDFGQ